MTGRRPGRVPPYDSDAETSLLGAMLLSAEARTAALDIVGPGEFYSPKHAHVFRAIANLHEAGIAIDPVTVKAELADAGLADAVGGMAALQAFMFDTPATTSAARYAQIIRNYATARRLIGVGAEIAQMGYDWPDRAPAAVERAQELLSDVAAQVVQPAGAEPVWPTLEEPAWLGPLGQYARDAAEHTEADPVGILVCALAEFGALVGAGPHINAGNVAHGPKVYPVLVGQSAKARKGSGHAGADLLLRQADHQFRQARVVGGFNSGEAIADALSDTNDVRLLCLEPEFGRFLAAASRDGSTMSAITRQAWDGSRIETRARASKVIIDDHHLVVVAQVTAEELRAKLRSDDIYNGFCNRFLWVAVRRGALQPDGGNIPDEIIRPAAEGMAKAARAARSRGQMVRDATAQARWKEVYAEIAADDPPGALGAATSRGDAQTLRLSMLYALADGQKRISAAHVEAAYALWRYCRASAAWIWTNSDDDPIGRRILDALRQRAGQTMSTQDVHHLFGRNQPASRLHASLATLEQQGQIHSERVPTRGRPSTVWGLTNERTKR